METIENSILPQTSPLDLLSFGDNSSLENGGNLSIDSGSLSDSSSQIGGGSSFALLGVGGNPFATGITTGNGNETMGNGNWQLIDGKLQSIDGNATGGKPLSSSNSAFSDGIPLPFGIGEVAVGDGNTSSSNNTTVGNGNWHLGSNNTTLGNGNWNINDDNATIGNGNWNFGSSNATIGNGNWYLDSDKVITDNSNVSSDDNDIITGIPLQQNNSDSWDNKIIIGNDDWVIVTDRDAIAGDGVISNDQIIANINALIYQVGLDFVGLLGGSMTFNQPTSTQGTATNNSDALNTMGNEAQLLPPLSGIPADMSSDLATM